MIDEDRGKRAEGAASFLMDCNLAQEVALIVLDSVQTISNQIAVGLFPDFLYILRLCFSLRSGKNSLFLFR